jgi:hypothetical protein
MQTLFHPEPLEYTGYQLRSHWILDTFGLQGDAMVAFCGPCRVALTEMVDLADVAAGQPIAAADMLHFLAEHFDRDLEKAVLRQRLFICMIAEALARCEGVPALRREGDDLYAGGAVAVGSGAQATPGERKLSVSIATLSPVSALMHVGLNLDASGAPVPAVGLHEWGLDPRPLAQELLAAYARELADLHLATSKVRGVQ